MQLIPEQRRDFFHHGFVVIRDAVPRSLCDRAVRAINHELGKGMDPALMWQYHSQSFCPDLRGSRVISELFTHSPAQGLLTSLLGEQPIQPVTEGQIALRFPALEVRPQPERGHVDGIADTKGHNGVPVGRICSFTALAGVLLSDCPTPGLGNFTVWPGTHRSHAAWLRTHGVTRLLTSLPEVDLPEPVAITGRTGDLVLAHYLLGHTVGPHHGPHIRYMCFFRVWAEGHDGRQFAAIANEWHEWPGMQALVDANPLLDSSPS